MGLAPRKKHAVLEAVDETNSARFTYLCAKADDGVRAVEVATVGIIACVLAYWIETPLQHPDVEEAAETVASATWSTSVPGGRQEDVSVGFRRCY